MVYLCEGRGGGRERGILIFCEYYHQIEIGILISLSSVGGRNQSDIRYQMAFKIIIGQINDSNSKFPF